jgi:4-amino-4-deoxy-L-arabinose transferase-like glycosyltransferase
MSSPAMILHGTKTWTSALTAPKALWVIVASLLILVPVLLFGIPSNIDLSNHFRFALPFYDALQNGHVYPGWLAESNSGYGDPSFRFYPPGTYYLLAGARAITGSWFSGSVLAFGVLSVLGSLGVYWWARQLVSSQLAMWAGILYAVAPYRINELYQAFLLAEFAGAAVLPFAFLFTERLCNRVRLRDVGGLAASYAILVFTHLPLTVIGSMALLVYAVIRIERGRRWKTLISFAISVVLGLVASASYWSTMISELSWIRADNINPYSFVDYRSNFLLSTFSPENLNVWWMNILLLGTLAMFWPGFILFRPSVWKSAPTRGLKAVGVVLMFTVAMGTQISAPLWKLLRPLQETQFPWRWLTLTSMVCPILCAASLSYWTKQWHGKLRPLIIAGAGIVAISLAFSVSHIIREAQYLKRAEFDATLRALPGSQGVMQWWPKWVNEPIREMDREVDAGARTVLVKSWESQKRVFLVEAGAASDVRVRTFYYPLWTATSDNGNLAVRPDTDGALVVSVPPQKTAITLEFREPARVRRARALSGIAWIGILGLVSFGIIRRETSPVVAAT